MRRATWAAAALLAVVVGVTGCSSSGSPPASPVNNPTAPAPATTPASSSSPAPSPSTSAPLSPYEADPAVRAMRAWAVQAGRTVNAGHFDDKALNALMTPAFAKQVKYVLGDDVGLYYPGPLPFTPLGVTVTNATQRKMRLCVVGSGFAQNPKTHRPAAARKVLPINAAATRVSGTWLISQQQTATNFSCAGVKVAMPTWAK